MGIIMDIIICCFILSRSPFLIDPPLGRCKEDTIVFRALSTLFTILHGISIVFTTVTATCKIFIRLLQFF
nr:hypothetical protein [Clostridia bacterium]